MSSLADACRQFEAVVLKQSLEAAGFGRIARTSEPNADDDDADPNQQASVFQSLIVESMADAVARSGGIGLARELERSLLRAQK